MKAKLVNGVLENFTQPDWLLGDPTDYATEQGYKEVIYQHGTGGIYETETNIIVEVLAPIQSTISPLGFLSRFTQDELRAIFTAIKNNIDVEIWKVKFDKASFIDLIDPLTVQGVDLLIQLGLLGADRKAEILLIS